MRGLCVPHDPRTEHGQSPHSVPPLNGYHLHTGLVRLFP
jgi:hypothetical protein